MLGFGPPATVLVIAVVLLISGIKILREYERGVIFRLGKLLPRPKGPGVILVFNFAALQHNLDAWEYASEKAKTASAVAMKCVGSETEGISGLPGSLRGVPFHRPGPAEIGIGLTVIRMGL